MKPSKITILVILFSIFITFALGVSVWDINFWPTDTRVYYFDAALELRNLKHVSQMHELIDQERVKWLHGKEMFILSASLIQRIMQDFVTLRPFILVCLISTCLSFIFVFLTVKNYWGEKAGLVCFSLFVTSFWPYIYILFAKHQPLGLLFFLLAVYGLQKSRVSKWQTVGYVLSGCSIGIALFSSSISALYFPYYVAAFLWHQFTQSRNEDLKHALKNILISGILILLGFIVAFAYFNFPNIVENVKSYWDYVKISGSYNHFFYNQRVLQQWIPAHIGDIRGGWDWIFKYFRLIMPVVFPVFLLCNVFVLVRCFFMKGASLPFKLSTLLMILLSWSSPILAEIRGVAQYGGNYFTSIVGILMLIGYTVYLVSIDDYQKKLNRIQKTIVGCAVLYIAIFHLTINVYVFWDDIYPTRMATTFLSDKILEQDGDNLHTYNKHPLKTHMVAVLNPKVFEKKKLVTIRHINQVSSGIILVPPVTGNSIYNVATSFYTDYDEDIFLNELVRKDLLEKYAIASYKTLASSRIWPHEEEILSYRYLILNQFSPETIKKGKVWLLDAKKLRKDVFKNAPSKDAIFLTKNKISNIGTKTPVYVYKGYYGSIDRPTTLRGIVGSIYKVGNPTDQLQAYVYRVDDVQNMWVPYNEHFKSTPVAGEGLTDDPKGKNAYFHFANPLELKPGSYYFTIYRTGQYSDEHYYRIYREKLGNLYFN